MAFQLSDARQGLEDVLRDISDVSDDLVVRWCNYVAIEAYHFLLGVDAAPFTKSATFSAALTGAQALPTDFDGIQYDGCGFFLCNPDGSQSDQRLGMTWFGATSQGFYIDRGNVVFTGIANPIRITLRYVPEFTLFSSINDYFTVGGLITDPEIIPEDHMEVVVAGICYQYRVWDEDTAMMGSDLAKWRDLLNDLGGHTRKIPQAFSTPDASSMY